MKKNGKETYKLIGKLIEEIKLLKKEAKKFENPIATEIGERKKDPFLVLISCILSLRTKDTTTGPAAKRLFDIADSPKSMLKLTKKQIEKAIFPVGFYPTKAKYIQKTCKKLIDDYDGKVPEKEEELLKLPGIGRKCMGITMCYGFGKNSHIPVDTHVFKIANRLGWVRTKTPEKTELSLIRIIPKKYWHDLNNLLVAHGQNICVPVSPYCSKCAIRKYCPRIGVKRSR
ncbi:MAG TPA: endonuclease III [Candidatus Woesearchaeota archaeon]|jgi:endonuclease-3|nr:endonuclease III [Candidatus Woesearchaeota archaeon]|tara:strand:- start:32668 stop:33354 length:687 start_codon:yes stop_codon:yes gene_type:complete